MTVPVAEFLKDVPADISADPSLKDIKDVAGLAKSYVNSQKMLGSRIAIPGETATEAERNEFYAKLGRPEKPDAYEFKDDGLPNEIYGRQEILQTMRTSMHKHGLSKKQAEAIFADYTALMHGNITKLSEEATGKKTAAVEALKKEWGGNYDKNLAIAKAAFKKFGADPELTKFVDDSRLGDHPGFIKLFQAIGAAVGGDKLIEGGGAGGGGTTAEQAIAKIAEMEANPEIRKALTNPSDPAHKTHAAERTRLFSIAYPNQNIPQ